MDVLKGMSGALDLSKVFISDEQRKRIVAAVINAYYADVPERSIIFDTNRGWPMALPVLSELFPDAKVVCCLRSVSWILDSIERQVARHPWQPSKMFNYNPAMDVYSRVEVLIKDHLVGPSLRSLRQAWFSEYGKMLIGFRYESLTEDPAESIRQLYGALGERPFEHDFNNLHYEEPEYDNSLGMPGFHTVKSSVEPNRRATILPPDIFCQYNECFWEDKDSNPRGITII
jgi:sulfotransferase